MNHKTLIMLLILLVLVAGGLFATDSRMTALGYPYGFLRDNTDIHAYPATIFKYNRSMTGELYDAGDDWNWTLGANVPINSSVFGLYLNLPTGVDVGDHLDWNYGYRDTDLDISKKIQFYFGSWINLLWDSVWLSTAKNMKPTWLPPKLITPRK